MSIIRRNTRNLDPPDEEILVNPRLYRPLIFSAIKNSFPTVMLGRVCHYTKKRAHESSNINHLFNHESLNMEVNFTVSKFGQSYVVQGTVKRKDTGEVIAVKGYVKSIPKKTPSPTPKLSASIPATVSRILISLSRLEYDVRALQSHLQEPPILTETVGQNNQQPNNDAE